nr:hypothetical protein GCM10025732_38300 [Glycomyces mayteni]
MPTPPEAPLTRTRVPGAAVNESVIAAWAVSPDMTEAAASVKDSASGLGRSRSAAVTVYSANVPAVVNPEPHLVPKTASPTPNAVTPSPRAATVPATSVPRTAPFARADRRST